MVKLELPSHSKIHDVVHAVYTRPYHELPSYICTSVTKRTYPVPAVGGEEYVVESILKQRKRGKVYQFLILVKGSPTHNAEWQPRRHVIDKDGTITSVFREYIKKSKKLSHLYEEDG